MPHPRRPTPVILNLVTGGLLAACLALSILIPAGGCNDRGGPAPTPTAPATVTSDLHPDYALPPAVPGPSAATLQVTSLQFDGTAPYFAPTFTLQETSGQSGAWLQQISYALGASSEVADGPAVCSRKRPRTSRPVARGRRISSTSTASGSFSPAPSPAAKDRFASGTSTTRDTRPSCPARPHSGSSSPLPRLERIGDHPDALPLAAGPVDRDDIESTRPIEPAGRRQIVERHRGDAPAFPQRNLVHGRAAARGPARLDLDEDDRPGVAGDDVDFSKPCAKTARKNCVPAAHQFGAGEVFALFSEDLTIDRERHAPGGSKDRASSSPSFRTPPRSAPADADRCRTARASGRARDRAACSPAPA